MYIVGFWKGFQNEENFKKGKEMKMLLFHFGEKSNQNKSKETSKQKTTKIHCHSLFHSLNNLG